MEAMAHNMEQMMHDDSDSATPRKRGEPREIHRTFTLPGAQLEIDVVQAAPPAEGNMMKLFKEAKNRGRVVSAIMKRRAKMMAARGQAVKTMLKRRMQAIRKGMIRNMQRLRGGHGPRWMPRAFFMKMWLRKT